MVKEPSAIKKKRKTTSGDADGEKDIYRKVVEFEEKEAADRACEENAKVYFSMCSDIREHMAQLNESGKGSTDKETVLLQICMKIAVMKKLNRIDKLKHVFGKESLNVEKQKCDSIKLVYQNLVYELNHLMHEVTKCNSFKSKHEDIDLIELEEFLKEAPKELTEKFTKIDSENNDEQHSLTLARLEFELQQRKTLAKSCESLHEEKKKLAGDIIERRNKLDGLLPLLNTIINATKPLQEYLNIPIDKVRAEHDLAKALPDPLYIFYANVMAYSEVYDVKLSAKIIGDQDEAIQFNEAYILSNLDDGDSDTEAELPEVEEIVEVKKRRHRKSMQVDPMEEKKKKLMEVHPLSVEVILDVKNSVKIVLTFKYCTRLKIVTVTSQIDLPPGITGNCSQDILSGENLLSELSPGDFGTESPNPSTPYQLKKVNLGSFSSLVTQIGYAYNWAQANCGINFLNKKVTIDEISRADVEKTFKILTQRIITRTDLAKQLQKLEQNIIPDIPESVNLPRNMISNLSKFTSISYQSFCQKSRSLVEEEFVSPTDMFFSVVITRNVAQLEALVAIKNSYPNPGPVFSLTLTYKGTVFNVNNSDDLRDMERAINLNINGDSAWLLAVQITYLCAYLDVFLETNFVKDFPQSTMFLRNISGRNRRRPLKFRKIGTGIFTQY